MIKKLLATVLWMISATTAAAQFGSQSVYVFQDTGQVLYEKQPDVIRPIASLTKLMTAMVVLDARQDMQEIITIEQSDVDIIKHSMSRVRVGWKMTREHALQLALMSSDNRAAVALGRTFPGGIDAFVSAARAKAASLQMVHTTIVEPSGLSPYNVSTARDLVRMAIAAYAYPVIARMSTDKSRIILANGKGVEFRNTNSLVRNGGWDIRLSKTGYIEEAGRCLIMRLVAGGKTATLALLNAGASSVRIHDAQTIRRGMGGEVIKQKAKAKAKAKKSKPSKKKRRK